MPRIKRLIVHLFPFVFAVLALAFSLKATTSRDWAVRYQYSSDEFAEEFTKPIYTEYRSPFIICSSEKVDVKGSNGSMVPTYPLNCLQYQVTGTGKTSCELAAVTPNDSVAEVGDARLCQQIHYAGNLSIAASSFIGFGFLLIFTMTGITLLIDVLDSSSTKGDGSSSNNNNNGNSSEKISTTEPPLTSSSAEPPTTVSAEGESKNSPHAHAHHHHQDHDDDKAGHHHGRHGRHHRHRYLSPNSPWINACLIVSLVVGAALTLLAQFYGVLAFTISAPDNGLFSTARPGDIQDQRNQHHAPWIQGPALTVFGSLAWLCAGLAAVWASIVWRTPRMKSII